MVNELVLLTLLGGGRHRHRGLHRLGANRGASPTGQRP
jgi:hypothetical protein